MDGLEGGIQNVSPTHWGRHSPERPLEKDEGWNNSCHAAFTLAHRWQKCRRRWIFSPTQDEKIPRLRHAV